MTAPGGRWHHDNGDTDAINFDKMGWLDATNVDKTGKRGVKKGQDKPA